MLKRILVLATIFSLLATAGALAAYDQYYPVNDYAAAANGFFSPEVVAVILVLGIVGVLLDSNFGGSAGSSDDSHSTDTAEHYEQEAVRLRAYARKLDAETAAKESQLRATIKSDELKEVERLLRDNKSQRGR